MVKYLTSAFLLSFVLFNACNGLSLVQDSYISIDGCPMQPLIMCIMQAPMLCKSDLECGVGSKCCPSSCGGASCLAVETGVVSALCPAYPDVMCITSNPRECEVSTDCGISGAACCDYECGGRKCVYADVYEPIPMPAEYIAF
jgi:hypothetical protein